MCDWRPFCQACVNFYQGRSLAKSLERAKPGLNLCMCGVFPQRALRVNLPSHFKHIICPEQQNFVCALLKIVGKVDNKNGK